MRSGGFNRSDRQNVSRATRVRVSGKARGTGLLRIGSKPEDQRAPRDLAGNILYEDVRVLLAEVARQLAAQEAEGVADVLHRLSQQDLGEASFREPQPQRQPVLSHLPQCLAEAGRVQPVVAAQIARLESAMQWQRSPVYSDLIMGNGFNANYGWSHIIGPDGFFPGDDFLMGLLMLGPDRHYPDRYQPAPELCWPLTPESFWSKGGKPFFVKRQGTTVWHPSMTLHATMTGASPLLALWIRTHDTASPTRLKWL